MMGRDGTRGKVMNVESSVPEEEVVKTRRKRRRREGAGGSWVNQRKQLKLKWQ